LEEFLPILFFSGLLNLLLLYLRPPESGPTQVPVLNISPDG